MNRRFTKIKIAHDEKTGQRKMFIEFQKKQGSGEGWDEYSVNAGEPPHADLISAMGELAAHVVDICELPKAEISEKKISVRSVSFHYVGEKEVMGAVITAMRSLKNSSPMLIDTPYKASASQVEGKAAPLSLLSDGAVVAINKLWKETDRYLEGHRLQTNLFEPSEKSAEAAA